MAFCTRCGGKLGLLDRARGCGTCASNDRADARAAAEKYVQLLTELQEGVEDPELLVPVLRESAQASGIPHKRLAEMNEDAFIAYANKVLSDDILSESEEKRLLDIGQALGMPEDVLQRSHPELLYRLAVAQVNGGRIPELDSPNLLCKKGEVVHAEMPAVLVKEVAIREYRGGYNGVSFKVMKGVRYHVGGARGRSVVVGTELQAADEGVLSLSSQRAVFMGAKKTLEFGYTKLVNLQVFEDGLQLNVSNRQMASLLKVPSGDVAAAFINAAFQRL